MTKLTIDTDNNITAHPTAEESTAASGAERFTERVNDTDFHIDAWNMYKNGGTGGQMARRRVQIWNSPPGVSPVEKFKEGSVNAPGTFGNAGLDILRGPRFFNTDMGLLKNTKIRERMNLQFRAELFDIFNNANFEPPNSTISSARK